MLNLLVFYRVDIQVYKLISLSEKWGEMTTQPGAKSSTWYTNRYLFEVLPLLDAAKFLTVGIYIFWLAFYICTQRKLSGWDLCPVLTALWIIYSVSVATLFIFFIELPLTDLSVGSNALHSSVGETIRLQNIKKWKIYFELCQTWKHFDAEKGHDWQELSQRSFRHHLVLNANAESFLGTWTNIIDLWWNLHFPVVLPTEIWPPNLSCC